MQLSPLSLPLSAKIRCNAVAKAGKTPKGKVGTMYTVEYHSTVSYNSLAPRFALQHRSPRALVLSVFKMPQITGENSRSNHPRQPKTLIFAQKVLRMAPFTLFLLACSLASQLQGATPSPQETAVQVDQFLMQELFKDVSPGELADTTDDQTFLRRVWLDLAGQLPPPEQVILFVLDKDPTKREQLVDTLLSDQRFGNNWASYWRDVILYRRTEERAIFSAQALTDYLSDHLNANTPWDQVTSEFVTATGNVRENGSAAVIMAQGGRPEETAAELTRIFMGIQIQCAQCHDHPYDRWRREQFHELAAFFPRVAVRPDRSAMQRTFVVVANDRPARRKRKQNNNNRRRGTPEHHMPDLDNPSAEGTLMVPALFTTGQRLELDVTDAERRAALAAWMTSPENEWFSKALVNRVWSEMVGEGFREPIDDLGPDRETRAPQTFDFLSRAFTQSGYDIKWLFKTITATQAYQRQSRARQNAAEVPFAANRPRRLRADTLFDTLLTVLNVTEQSLGGRRNPARRGRGRNGPRAVFNKLFEYDPSEPQASVTGSIPQALALMNSAAIHRSARSGRDGGLASLLQNIPDNQDLLTEIYLKCLAREPSPHEQTTCLLHIKQTQNPLQAFEDILWALINSAEFQYRT